MEAAAILTGIFLWALMIVVAFVLGPLFFSAGLTALIVFVVTALMAVAIIRALFSVLAILPEDRLVVAALAAAPMLVLDIVLIIVAPILGETFSGAAGRWFAAWLVLPPTLIVLTGLRMRKAVR